MIESKPKIVVIDDSEVDRELIKSLLQTKGFEILALNSAINIIDIIANEKPDLILLDIMMKEVNGNEALEVIRKKYSQIEMPVIMVTAKTDELDVLESFNKGANDYIIKPIKFEVAYKRIQTQLMLTMQAKAMVKAKEIETIHSMIATYNHEINNPLAIAVGNLDMLKEQNSKMIKKIQDAVWRIAEVVKKTNTALARSSFEYEKYYNQVSLLKLKEPNDSDS